MAVHCAVISNDINIQTDESVTENIITMYLYYTSTC